MGSSGFRALLLLTLGAALIAGYTVFLSYLFQDEAKKAEPSVSISFKVTTFDALKGWEDDPLEGVLETLLRSCKPLLENRMDTDYLSRPFGGGSHAVLDEGPYAGTRSDWLPICIEAETIEENKGDPREFLTRSFTPVVVYSDGNRDGLYTGYYEPELSGAREKKGENWVPLLTRPDDLVSVDLGAFRDDLKGKRLAGRVEGGALRPFEDRAAIEAGELGPTAKPIVWVDDAVDAFFLHIQGSGRVKLDTGEVLRVGYAGQNGHPYVAIGRVLVERGAMPLEKVSMQTIRSWLMENPGEARDVMAANGSYIFFQELDVPDPSLGPLGADGTHLTPGRSLAVDRKFHALGLPVWVETRLPADLPEEEKGEIFQRLMIAQDTGGAIQGPVRGDIFFGPGEAAADLAGRMKSPGTLTLLLPNPLAERLLSGGAASETK